MRKIPLHSIVVWLGDESEITNHFPENEKLSKLTLLKEFGISGQGNLLDHDLDRELLRRLDWRIQNGQRTVVWDRNCKPFFQNNIQKLARNHNIPLFYMVTDNPLDYWSQISHDLMSDGRADVIDTAKLKSFVVIKKYDQTNLIDHIQNSGFSGITAVGDIHGQLEAMKSAVDWARQRNHFLIFLGDVLDYGPRPIECIELVYELVTRGLALMVIGNHEKKILKWLQQRNTDNMKIRISSGNKITIDCFNSLPKEKQREWESKFIGLMQLSSHYYVANNVMFVHGGALPEFWTSNQQHLYGSSESRAIFGQTEPGKLTENGYPVRIYDWGNEIPEGKTVIIGHDIASTSNPITKIFENKGQIIMLDTGSGKNGVLSSADLQITETGLKLTNFNQH